MANPSYLIKTGIPPGLYLSFSHKKNASTYHDQEDIPRLKEMFFMELSHLFSFAENL
ncbi:hypothetical protein PAGL106935_06460 [Paenibacillus glucanolyticus]|jgi:hypothetical protein